MTPSLSIASTPMPVANTSAPGVAAASATSPNAPASQAVDFMSMIGQLTATVAPTPASTAMQAPALPAWKSLEEIDTKEPEATDLLGVMPLSLPVLPADVKIVANPMQTALLGVTGDLAKVTADAVAPDAQLLTDLIQSEQTPAQGKFEIPQLSTPATDAASATKQSDAAAYSRPVHTPVGTAAWNDEIGTRLTMMVEKGQHTASLRLSPEHLGPLEVHITMNDDQASVWFGAAHADTRSAIENALPRLRELFASQGLSLADAGVHREPPRQQSSPVPQASTASGGAGGVDGTDTTSAAIASRIRLGLVDAYA